MKKVEDEFVIHSKGKRKQRSKIYHQLIDVNGDVLYSCISRPEIIRVFNLVCKLCPDAYFGVIQQLDVRYGGALNRGDVSDYVFDVKEHLDDTTLDQPDHSSLDLTDVGTLEV